MFQLLVVLRQAYEYTSVLCAKILLSTTRYDWIPSEGLRPAHPRIFGPSNFELLFCTTSNVIRRATRSGERWLGPDETCKQDILCIQDTIIHAQHHAAMRLVYTHVHTLYAIVILDLSQFACGRELGSRASFPVWVIHFLWSCASHKPGSYVGRWILAGRSVVYHG